MWEDARTAFRVVRRFPVLMVVAMASIAIVVAAVTVFTSVVQGLLFWQPNVHSPEQLRTIEGGHSLGGRISYPDFQDYREATRNVASLAALMFDGTSVTLRDQTEVVADGVVSGNYFTLLGVSAGVGRVFAEDQTRIEMSVVLSDRLWRRFGASPDIVGKTVLVYDTQYTVIGVLPASFQGFSPELPIDIWLSTEGAQRSTLGPLLRNRRTPLFTTVARISIPTVTPRVLDAFRRVDVSLDQQFGPPRVKSGALRLVNPRGILDPPRRKAISEALALLGLSLALILLIVFSNVASLMLTVMRQRRREIAVRSALGANALRLLRQLGIEGILIWGTAGVAGLLLAVAATAVATNSFPPRLFGVPLALGVQLNALTLAISVGSCVVVGLFFSCLSAVAGLWRSALSHIGATRMVTDTGGKPWSPGVVLVAFQVALSMALVVANAQIMRSLNNASHADLGYETTGRIAQYLHPNPTGFPEAGIPAFYNGLLERVRALPGVRSAAIVDFLPLSGLTSRTCHGSAGAPPPPPNAAPQVGLVTVSPGYFKTLGIPLVSGRDLTDADARDNQPAIVVNQSLAGSRWPGQNAVGQQLRVGPDCATTARIVGVVADAAQSGIDSKGEEVVYAPFDRQSSPWRTLVTDVSESPALAIDRVRREILMVSPGASIQRGQALDEEVSVRLWPMRATAAMMGVLGIVGILVTTSGVYALISAFVAARTREIGMRIALGASPRRITWLIAPACLAPSVVGLLLGLYLGNRGTQLAIPVLYGVNPADFAAYGIAMAVLLASIVIAVWLPTRRATRIDPSEALRSL